MKKKNTFIYYAKNQIAHQTVQKKKTLRIEMHNKCRSFQIATLLKTISKLQCAKKYPMWKYWLYMWNIVQCQ